jgi:hypothetical protein
MEGWASLQGGVNDGIGPRKYIQAYVVWPKPSCISSEDESFPKVAAIFFAAVKGVTGSAVKLGIEIKFSPCWLHYTITSRIIRGAYYLHSARVSGKSCMQQTLSSFVLALKSMVPYRSRELVCPSDDRNPAT